MLLRASAFAALFLATIAPPAPAQVSSTFDTDPEGWQAATFPVRGPYGAPLAQPALTYRSDGGNPGGYIEIEDPDNNVVFWEAPSAFLGDQSGAYGGTLRFDLLNSSPINYTDDFDLVLHGADLALLIELEPPSQGTWTSYEVGLTEDFEARSGWMKDGEPPTEAEFRSVLGALDALLIRAEHSNDVAGEFMGLDNPELGLRSSASETAVPLRDGLALTDLHPHPLASRGTLRIRSDRPQAARAEVFDLLGRRVGVLFEGTLAAGETALPLDVARLRPGLYIVRVQTERASAARRVNVAR